MIAVQSCGPYDVRSGVSLKYWTLSLSARLESWGRRTHQKVSQLTVSGRLDWREAIRVLVVRAD